MYTLKCPPETNTVGSLNLPFSFHGHFPGVPALAGTKMSTVCILSKLRMMEVVITTGATTSAKLPSNRHQQHTNTELYRPDALPVAQPTALKHWSKYVNENMCTGNRILVNLKTTVPWLQYIYHSITSHKIYDMCTAVKKHITPLHVHINLLV